MIGSIMTPRFIFGKGVFEKIGIVSAEFGKSAGLFISSSSTKNGLVQRTKALLSQAGIESDFFVVPAGEPTPQVMRDGAEFLRKGRFQMVIAVGGGSVIDTGKLAAALAVNPYDIMAYIEGVGSEKLTECPLPFIAVPTTAGTGSEMTKNSVVIEPGQFKNSVRDDRMLAKAALVDPMLTLSLPKSVTVSSGADAVCQLIEAYSTRTPNSYTDALAISYIVPMIKALETAAADGSNEEAREMLALGASVSGICLANSGLGLAHGISAALGTVAGVPHGIGCGILMPVVAQANAEQGVVRYVEIARRMGVTDLDVKGAGRAVAQRLKAMNEKIGIPPDLRQFGIRPDQVGQISALAARSSSGRKNPVSFGEKEIQQMILPLI